jgi:LacI family transcriptional regulator
MFKINPIKLIQNDVRPLFIQLRDGIYRQIQERKPVPGTKLLPINEIARLNNISLWTVESAVNELIKQNILFRRAKQGTYISSNELVNKSRTKNICFFINEQFYFSGEPFYIPILNSCQKELKQQGYNTIYSVIDKQVYEENRVEEFLTEILESRKIDGIIVAGDLELKLIRLIKKQKILSVFIDYDIYEDNDMNCILIDNYNGSIMATEYLVELGHRKIGFVGGSKNYPSIKERISGYKHVLERNKISYNKYFSVNDDRLTIENGYMLAKKMLQKKNIPTAIVSSNDTVGIGVVKAIKEKGLSVPGDISVVGFDDIGWSRYTEPPLTTIKVFKEDMGRAAARRILELVNGDQSEPVKTRIKTELIIRESCRELK